MVAAVVFRNEVTVTNAGYQLPRTKAVKFGFAVAHLMGKRNAL